MIPLTKYSLTKESITEQSIINLTNLYLPKVKTSFQLATENKAKNFNQLISFIREAEDKLIAAGYKEIEKRIHILRGIYYGTPWSLDFSVEQSIIRNTGFQSYTYSKEPDDPRKILGLNSFQKLFNSAEVIQDNTKAIDFGHIIIGLDARLSFLAREAAFPFHGGGTGLEICTWVGDIGGAAGMLAINRISNPQKRAIDKFKGSSFGGWVNFEGNIASYLIGRDKSKLDSTPSLNLKDDVYIADAIKDYLIIDTIEWENRSKNFLKMLGAEIDDASCEIKNFTALRKVILGKVLNFAEFYMNVRLFQNNKLNVDSLIEASSHLIGASKEVVDIFLYTLLQTCKTPNNPVKVDNSFNPSPSPKGKPFIKYTRMKQLEDSSDELKHVAEDFIKEIEKQFIEITK